MDVEMKGEKVCKALVQFLALDSVLGKDYLLENCFHCISYCFINSHPKAQ